MPCVCKKVKRPCFGLKTDTKATRCKSCALENMIDLRHPRCFCGNRLPAFGILGYEATHCAKCKSDDMVRIGKNLCSCRKTTCYGLPGKRATHCTKCKEPGMVNVHNRRCFCGKGIPYLGFKDDERATRCKSCALPDMQNITSKKCIVCEDVRPTFGLIKGKPSHCGTCKTVDMQDVSNKRCSCGKSQPNFGLLGERATHCAECKNDEMQDITNTTCECGIRACFGFEWGKPTHCASCRLDGMTNVKNRSCTSEWCFTIPKNNKYKGYCLFCFINLFPDEKVSRNYKTKQKAVEECVENAFGEYSWVKDKTIQDGCSKRRPDLFLDMGGYTIVIEIDENQHIDYDCENKRVCQLFQDSGSRPMYIVRFNPDELKDVDGLDKPSCWGYDSHGRSRVKPSARNQWDDRLETLVTTIKRCIDVPPTKEIETIQLYFDVS